MIEPILLPAMTGAQFASWHALMDMHERLPDLWTLVGGQMVHLHCAEHGVSPERPTAPTLETPGGSQALARSESVRVTVEGRTGRVRRPNLVGAHVMKAAAHTVAGDAGKARHRRDFVTLSGLVGARDFRDAGLRPKDRQRLRAIVAASRSDRSVMLGQPDAERHLVRIERAADLL